MVGLSLATQLIQGSTERTWNCVINFLHLIWEKVNHISQPIMPKSRKRHHSHSRSRSPSREREEKHKKNDSHEKDRDGKRRKIELYESPNHKRSVSSEPEGHQENTAASPQTDGNGAKTEMDVDTCQNVPRLPEDVDGKSEDAKIGANPSDERVIDEKQSEEVSGKNGNEKKTIEGDDATGDPSNNDVEKNVAIPLINLDNSDESDSNNADKSDPADCSLIEADDKLELLPKKVSSPEQKQEHLEELKEKEPTIEDTKMETELSSKEKDMEEQIEVPIVTVEEKRNNDEDDKTLEISCISDDEENNDIKSIDVINLVGSEKDCQSSSADIALTKAKNNLEVTPKKVSSPKQLQKKLESERKRLERQKEKEDKEKKRNDERERIRQEKIKKKEEKQRELEQKQKERELKEEQRKKEREDKEEQQKKEKEQKRKEKEEKEQKRKEREHEKLKKQQEIEEKNKEKQKEEEKKQKTAAAFVNFFVPIKTDNIQEDKKMEEVVSSAFMAFEVKSDMKLPPPRRTQLSKEDIATVDKFLNEQDDTANYLKDLRSGKTVGKSLKTWPYEEPVEEDDDDVAIVEDERDFGETICEDKPKLQKLRAKFLKFHENRRPAYYGTWRKESKFITPTKPFAEDKVVFNYEEDSDDDWEEEEQGESLNCSEDEVDKENDEKDDYEVDNDFFVPHGHLSDDEVDDEATAKLSPESLKQKLKLLKDEFDKDIHSKTYKLKPRSIGCIWYNKDGSNVDEAIDRFLEPLAIISNGQIEIKKRSEIFTLGTAGRKNRAAKELNPEYIPMFLKVIHGNTSRKGVLVEQFMTYMTNNGFTVDFAKGALIKKIKHLATWRKCKENGPMKNKCGWFVNADVKKEYNVDLGLPNILDSDNKK